ncbi:MAG: type VI secretion system baseplate subunit TssG [Acidobacteriota bacterium]
MTPTVHPRMPDFSHSHPGFHHTVDSALEVLSSLSVLPSRVTLRMAGRGWPTCRVVHQSPPPGAELTPDQTITLHVAGVGFFQSLPVGMWDRGGEVEMGTQEILEIVDDPLQKAAHWLREGARLFDVRPDNPQACARWISLFGLSAEGWPAECWYNLALFLPNLQRLAGREIGIRFALQLVLGLPLSEIRGRRSFSYLQEADLSLLAQSSSRLGVDLIVGDCIEDVARLVLVIGPVPLATYYEYQEADRQRVLDSVLQLCVTCHQKYRVSWLVQDPGRPPRLGFEEQNARLGINSHLGKNASALVALG